MDNKLIITPKEDTYVVLTVRIEKSVQENYDQWAKKTNYSRNALMSMALKYGLEHMAISEETSQE
ncbi:MAG: CopG family transcriptional regulator [Clostridiales bacterium]|nr:CopG family transcriptional regulator [Clostridiales bacterium]